MSVSTVEPAATVYLLTPRRGNKPLLFLLGGIYVKSGASPFTTGSQIPAFEMKSITFSVGNYAKGTYSDYDYLQYSNVTRFWSGYYGVEYNWDGIRCRFRKYNINPTTGQKGVFDWLECYCSGNLSNSEILSPLASALGAYRHATDSSVTAGTVLTTNKNLSQGSSTWIYCYSSRNGVVPSQAHIELGLLLYGGNLFEKKPILTSDRTTTFGASDGKLTYTGEAYCSLTLISVSGTL